MYIVHIDMAASHISKKASGAKTLRESEVSQDYMHAFMHACMCACVHVCMHAQVTRGHDLRNGWQLQLQYG